MRKANPYIGAVGRLLIAALFLISGLGKIAAPALTQGFITSAGLPFPLLASVFDTKPFCLQNSVLGFLPLCRLERSRFAADAFACC